MSTEYSDYPRRDVPHSPVRRVIPTCRCGHNGKLFEEDNGYVVVCMNRHCSEPPVADDEACATPAGAWSLWRWKATGAA